MATTFLMTEKALDDMIVQIADTYAKMRNNVQDCALACAQYAVLNCNAKPMNKLLAAMPERLRPWLLKHVTQNNVPLVFDKEKGSVSFSFKVAIGMLKAKGVLWESKKDVHNLSNTDKSMLERVWMAAEATLSVAMWDTKMQAAKKADKAAKDASRTDEQIAAKLLKDLDNLKKRADAAGVVLPLGEVEVTTVSAQPLPADVQEVVNILLPLSGNNAILSKVVTFALTLLTGTKEKAA